MALAPEQAGIGIRRYFTTPEVHPYDEVAWERRDARITNFRDGTVAFEQLDVEVPTDWSLNATNILAQKYFRGTVGTAERETSLRQVVDRVADTITAWGVQGGYFVDDDEADAFRAELKHLVVTQKAAFNSPVWFNIGVNGVPQQASACQPYDALVSTPDGLRPIGELVEGDEVGAKVFDAHGVTKVVAVKANGVKPVLRIHTKSGHILDVTSDHLVWRAGPGKGGFVAAGTLQPGDKLTWHRTESSGIGHITATAIAEAALAGWLQSDGFVGQYDHGTNRSLTAEFLTVTDAEHAWVTEALDVLMPDVHRHEREFKTVRTDLDGRRIRLDGEPLRSFVDSWGLLARGPEMKVPARLHDAPLPVVAAYLRSLFQAEGYVSIRDRAAVIGLDMVSEGVVRGAQQLLSRFGIFSRVGFKADKRADRLGCWSLSIRPLPDRRRFADEIGFIDSAKADKLAQSLEMLGIASSDSKRLEIRRIEDRGELPVYDIQTESGEYLSSNLRLHNCFILHVDDTMDSILNWYVEEGTIFKGGSGSGINLSGIRSSHERLKGGGTASGPVSFMRGADASAGTIKSGGKTRRAAKMVILNVDHPDIEEFIWCKAVEERKARVLRDAGFDMDLDGKDSHSTQYQNANNSVRVTDDFMQAVVDDADWHLRAVTTGEVVKSMKARDLMRQIAEAAWECADPGMQFDTTINRWHTAAATGRINGSNPCSEYMHLDNSACNLASLNLLKFLDADDQFDVEGYKRAVEVVFTAQEILVGNADYPTESIADTSRRFRQLGLGYANLGALLMALGLPYDSDAGRAWAGALTALMTGHAYLTSARTAARMGPFAGYSDNREHMLRVLDMHRKEAAKIDEELVPADLLAAAQESWDDANDVATVYGVRNSQASVIAPTGCLVGGSLVTTDRGLVRLRSLGDPDGPAWQDLGVEVQTDDGPRPATKFYVNGLEPVVDVVTSRGYRITGTTKHRIKVVDEGGRWVWRRFADVRPGDTVPLALDQVFGEPRPVELVDIVGSGKTTAVTAELAYLVGLFMGRGTISGRGIELSVPADPEAIERAVQAAKATFRVAPDVTAGPLARLVLPGDEISRWWADNGFARLTGETPALSGTRSWVPDRILATNDREVFARFAAGVREAAGEVDGVCRLDNARFAEDLQVLFLGMGEVGHRSGSTLSKVAQVESVVREDQAFFFDTVVSAELGDEELTYDISVPSNVTYVANGFISHNTIGLLMDCDTTGLEPDLGLVKMKKLVGGGNMSIVNQTIPRALRRLGYSADQIDEVIAYIDEHKSILGAPHLSAEHLPVFACSMGDNTIHYMGHIRMMAAIQPFISGALSKCVVGDTLLTTGDGLVRIGSLHRGEARDTFRSEIMEVASLDGTQKTDAFYYGGRRPVRDVTLRSGHRLTGTPNHRVLAGDESGLRWVPMDELQQGDMVAVQYGADLWSPVPATLYDFEPSPRYGSQKVIRLPVQMSDDLAFLLGAYAAEGHTTRSNWTISITNSVPGVRDRVAAAWKSCFGLHAKVVDDGVRCPMVMVASKAAVEFLEYLGCGGRASEKRIPDAVLCSTRSHVLSFLQGLWLDAYTSERGSFAKWAICLDAPRLLDDLQAVLTNLGVRNGRISKYNPQYDKHYDEVFVCGPESQRLLRLVPFLEPDKARRAEGVLERSFGGCHNTADVVPVAPRELYGLLPRGKSGRNGFGVRAEFAYLCDDRTRFVTRRTLERVAATPGVVLPPHLQQVLDDDLHFSPVVSVDDAGEHEVFDVSVPTTHAFVGNGIVNHNTVNVPEDVTVEDVEQLHIDAWKLGIKAVAMYRDNCKVAQPLSTVKKEALKAGADDVAEAAADIVERIVERVVTVKEPVRQKLPRNRTSRTFEFRVADCKGFVTVGEYADGRPGEIFMRVSKQGSTLAGIMDAFAISVSYGLQYGVPLRVYVETFTNMRFEPAGMTDDPDLRFATSLIDYIFRRLAVDYLSYEERAELNILTIGERTQPTLPGVEETAIETRHGSEMQPDPPSIESALTLLDLTEASSPVVAPAERSHPSMGNADAPICMQCGVQMQRAGSCHACPSCGSTSGCS